MNRSPRRSELHIMDNKVARNKRRDVRQKASIGNKQKPQNVSAHHPNTWSWWRRLLATLLTARQHVKQRVGGRGGDVNEGGSAFYRSTSSGWCFLTNAEEFTGDVTPLTMYVACIKRGARHCEDGKASKQDKDSLKLRYIK